MSSEMFDRGLAVRREVLGREHVDASLKAASADDFTQPLQQMVTEFCWGAVWTRQDLDRKSRSLINIAMLCALNRPHELKIHVRGALNNGVTREQIREVLLHCAIYAGVPAANHAFKVAAPILEELRGS